MFHGLIPSGKKEKELHERKEISDSPQLSIGHTKIDFSSFRKGSQISPLFFSGWQFRKRIWLRLYDESGFDSSTENGISVFQAQKLIKFSKLYFLQWQEELALGKGV